MTTVTILGEAQGVEPKKKIEFVKYYSPNANEWRSISESQIPECWQNVLLIRFEYVDDMDLMYGWSGEGMFCLFLGHFNDGIV